MSKVVPNLALPSLPGYSPRISSSNSPRVTSFDFKNGFAVERPPNSSSRRNLTKPLMQNRKLTIMNDITPPETKIELPEYNFKGYFMEGVVESRSESFRVRKVALTIFQDGTISVYEPKELNSGIAQGLFLKRSKIIKHGEARYLCITDFNINKQIHILGRVFHIVDADEATRRSLNITEAALLYPKTSINDSKQQSTMMSEANIAVSTSLGNIKPNIGLKQFLESDRQVLSFSGLWNDTAVQYGLKWKYVINIFLADNTMEILQVKEHNSGKENFPALLKRSKVFKKPVNGLYCVVNTDTSYDESLFFSPMDMQIGSYVEIMNRKILLYKANQFTVDWYMSQGFDYRNSFVNVSEPVPETKEIVIPPHTGFGSEEDSMKSCSHMLKPQKKDFGKLLKLDGKFLRFGGRLIQDSPIVDERRFVIVYYLVDDTITVFETRKRNSGRDAGNFLKRQKLKLPNGVEGFYTIQDCLIGSTIQAKGQRIEIDVADEHTLSYMEENKVEYPQSDSTRILANIREIYKAKNRREESVDNIFPRDVLNNIIDEELSYLSVYVYLRDSNYPVSFHECLTLIREYKNKKYISFKDFLLKA